MKSIKRAVDVAIKIANDPAHGYDQTNRLGPDFDCSSFISYCLSEAGFRIARSSWTGNMESQLRAEKFENCTAPWRKGDIHLTPGKHVAMSTDKDHIVHARINELGKTAGGKTGDQSGNEISITSYYNYPWKLHLRYKEIPAENPLWGIAMEVIQGKYGDYPKRKDILTAMGYEYRDVQDHVNAILVAKDVIKGAWGNGEERMKKLMDAGYDYCLVQTYVNKMVVEINGK